MTATASMNDKFQTFFTLTKVDEQKRLVYGRATQEVPDGVREIMDYKSSKPLFEKWSAAAKDRSKAAVEAFGKEAESLGNIRVQHTEEIGGHVVDINFNDAEKAIDIGTYCGNDKAWDMIKRGELTGFSVGGSYAKRWPDNSNPSFMRYTANPVEISYVDSPAVPTAKYTYIKSDGTSELRKAIRVADFDRVTMGGDVYFRKANTSGMWMTHDQLAKQLDIEAALPNEDNPAKDTWLENVIQNPVAPDVERVSDGAVVKEIPTVAGIVSPNIIDTHAVKPIEEPINDPVEKQSGFAQQFIEAAGLFSDAINKLAEIRKADADEKAKQESKLKSIGARVGIKRREGEPLTPPKGFPTDLKEYADPANYSWPLDTKARAQSAVAYFNAGGEKVKAYSPTEKNVLGRRIASGAAKQFGVKYRYDPKKKEVSRIEANKMALNKANAQAIVSQLAAAMGVAADQISDDPQAIADLLMAAMGTVDPASSDVSNMSTPSAPTGSQADASVASLKQAAIGVSPATAGQSASPSPSSPSSPSSSQTIGQTTSTMTDTGSLPTMTNAAPGTIVAPSSSSSSSNPSTPDASTKAFMDKQAEQEANIKAIAASMADIVKALGIDVTNSNPTANIIAPANEQPVQQVNKAMPVQTSIPLADLAKLIGAQQPQTNPVIDALTKSIAVDGTNLSIPDPNALRKAAEAAGSKDHPDERAAMTVAMQQVSEKLAKSGVFSEYWSKGGVFGPGSNANAQ